MEERFRKDYQTVKIDGITYYYNTVNLPETHQVIYGCEGGETARFPASINNIPVKAIGSDERFLGQGFTCKKAIFSEGIQEIQPQAFYDNVYIEEVILPTGLKALGWRAFGFCHNLRSVSLAHKYLIYYVTAFKGALNLQQIRVHDNNVIYSVKELLDLITHFGQLLKKAREGIALTEAEEQLFSMCKVYNWDDYVSEFQEEYDELFENY